MAWRPRSQGNSSPVKCWQTAIRKMPCWLTSWVFFNIWCRQYLKPFRYFLDTSRSLQSKGRHVDASFSNVTAFPIQFYGYLKHQCLSCNCDICKIIVWISCLASCAMQSTHNNDYNIDNIHVSFPGIIFKPKMNCKVRSHKRIVFNIMIVTATLDCNVQFN